MNKDDIRPSWVRKYIGQAGGIAAVAAALGVSFDEVIQWSRVGLCDDADRAIALTNMAFDATPRLGPKARCAVLVPGELNGLVKMLGGPTATARRLGISARTLRRYRAETTNLPAALADQVLTLLGYRPVADVDELFLRAHRRGSQSEEHSELLEYQALVAALRSRLASANESSRPSGRLLAREPAMSAEQFSALVRQLGSGRKAARALGCGHASVARYASGKRAVPAELASRLDRVLESSTQTGEPSSSQQAE